LVVFALGLIVPAILIAVLPQERQAVAAVFFGVAIVLAFTFGLIGRRYRMGQVTLVLSLLLIVGLALLWMSGSQHNEPQVDQPTSPAVQPGDDVSRETTVALEGEEHLPFPTLFFKAGEMVEPTEKVIYYKTPFVSPPYLTYDLPRDDGYTVTSEQADSFTLYV
jgi:hypothetical protein